MFSHLGDVTSEVMCNMGISASITQTEVIVGSPGSYEWQGRPSPPLPLLWRHAVSLGLHSLSLSGCVCVFAGNVHVSWMNPHVMFDTERSSFNNLQRRNIYIGKSLILNHM